MDPAKCTLYRFDSNIKGLELRTGSDNLYGAGVYNGSTILLEVEGHPYGIRVF